MRICEAQYLEGKARYALTIKNKKFSSWKAFCKLTPANNPWNKVYKLAAGKKKLKTHLTTLRKPNRTQTKDTADTLRHVLEHFTPEDNNDDDDDHRRARLQSQIPTSMADDKEFTTEKKKRET